MAAAPLTYLSIIKTDLKVNNLMSQNRSKIRKCILPFLLLLGTAGTSQAQDQPRPQPKLWLGVSGAANFNFYSGTTQTLNSSLKAPTAFHEGFGVGPYGSALLEYRPNPVLGLMLNLGYDGRGGSFAGVMAPCECPATLSTKLRYLTIEPSLRISPFSSGFYLFVGGAYSSNIGNSFLYTQKLRPDTKGEFSDMRKGMISGQVGAGYDIPLSRVNNPLQINLSPFVSYHPYFGQSPRSVESWSLQTVRAGVALKFGKAKVVVPPPVAEREVQFSVQAPPMIPAQGVAEETFPLANYVFFDEGSPEIPSRYVQLNKGQAASFREGQMQQAAPNDVNGRAERQLKVYYNVLNILGQRMRENPAAKVTLIGSSAGKGTAPGKASAESVKRYLVDVFGVDEARIATQGSNQPLVPSAQPGGKNELVLLREGDRRVDLVSDTPALLVPLRIKALPVHQPDSRITFQTEVGDKESLQTWSLEVTDEKGKVQRFGPFTKDQESISANTVLGDRREGTYKVVMLGQTKEGSLIRKESTMRLARAAEPQEEGVKFSVLFDFDKSKSGASSEKFLTEVVAPLIPENGRVVIHGHTDVIGAEGHNLKLSQDRARDVQTILERAVANAGKKGVTFEGQGFGADSQAARFGNKLPEERFYNRTVIINIVAPK